MPWCSLSFTNLLTRGEKPTVWLQMIVSGFLLTHSEHRTDSLPYWNNKGQECANKGNHVQQIQYPDRKLSNSCLCGIFLPAFSLCLWTYVFTYLWSHKEVCLCGFCTQWILLCRLVCWDNKDKICPFFSWSQTWEQKFFSIGRVGFLRRAAVSVCLSAALAKIPG